METKHRYLLRFTRDQHVIETGNDADALKRPSDYLIHIWDRTTGAVVWQNGPSVRYGDVAVAPVERTFF